jgi:hypothetical protein
MIFKKFDKNWKTWLLTEAPTPSSDWIWTLGTSAKKDFASILGPEYENILKGTAARGSYLHFDGKKLRFVQENKVAREWEASSGSGDAMAHRAMEKVYGALKDLLYQGASLTYNDIVNIYDTVAKKEGWDLSKLSPKQRGMRAGDFMIETPYGQFEVKAGMAHEALKYLAKAMRTGKDVRKKDSIGPIEIGTRCKRFAKLFRDWIMKGSGGKTISLIPTWEMKDFLDYCTVDSLQAELGVATMKTWGVVFVKGHGADFKEAIKAEFLRRISKNPKEFAAFLEGPRMKAVLNSKLLKKKINPLGRVGDYNPYAKGRVKSGAAISYYEEMESVGPIPEGIYKLNAGGLSRGLEGYKGPEHLKKAATMSSPTLVMDTLGYMFARHATGTQYLGNTAIPGLAGTTSGARNYAGFSGGTKYSDFYKYVGKVKAKYWKKQGLSRRKIKKKLRALYLSYKKTPSRHSRLAWGNHRISIRNFTKNKRIWNMSKIYGRGGFYIHGGVAPGSSGCIDLGMEMESFAKWHVAYGAAHGTGLKLLVSYSEEMMTALATALNSGNDRKLWNSLKLVFDKEKDVAKAFASAKKTEGTETKFQQ